MGRKGPEVKVKVVLLGSSNVGKTSLVEQYVFGVFKENNANTIGAAFCEKKEEVNGRCMSLQLWDTGGQERYRAMSSLYYRGAKTAIVCYDMTDSKSLDGIHYWIGDLQLHEPKCSICICGTKKDLMDGENNNDLCDKKDYGVAKIPVSQTNIKHIADSYGIPSDHIYQTSSKTGEGTKELFLAVAMDMSIRFEEADESGDRFSVLEPSSNSEDTQRRGKCCSS